jgi:hypothetical protein
MCVDAGNPKSYIGSGTAWSNIGSPNTANSATLVGAPTYNSANGGFFTFNGTTQYAIFGDIFNNVFVGVGAKFSVSAWVKPAATMTNNYIIGKWANTAGMWILRIGDGTTPDCANFFWGNPGNTAYINQNSTVSVTDTSKWYHLTGVYDISLGATNSMKIFVDGVDVSTYNQNNVGTPTVIEATTADLIIGNRLDLARGFNGSIANVSLYNVALTADEVAQNFNALRQRYGV